MKIKLTKYQLHVLDTINQCCGNDVMWLSMVADTTPQAFGRAGSTLREHHLAYDYDGHWFITQEGTDLLNECH